VLPAFPFAIAGPWPPDAREEEEEERAALIESKPMRYLWLGVGPFAKARRRHQAPVFRLYPPAPVRALDVADVRDGSCTQVGRWRLSAAYKIPAIYRLGEQAWAGGLMAYGPNIPYMYRQGALLVDKILRGANPADLPVEQPTNLELVLNLRTAKALGITFPITLLGRADDTVE
jgi:hypothetical protein